MEGWILIVIMILMVVLFIIMLFILAYLIKIEHLTEDTKQIVGLGVKVDPKFPTFIDLTNSIWRLSKLVEDFNGKLEGKDIRKLKSLLSKFDDFLEKNDIEYNDYTGRQLNNGMNIDILSSETDEKTKYEIIFDTHTPEIRHKGILRHKSQVIVHQPVILQPIINSDINSIESSETKEDIDSNDFEQAASACNCNELQEPTNAKGIVDKEDSCDNLHGGENE